MSQNFVNKYSLPLFAVGAVSLLLSLFIASQSGAAAATTKTIYVNPPTKDVTIHFLTSGEGSYPCGTYDQSQMYPLDQIKVKLSQPTFIQDSVNLVNCVASFKVLK